jgi:Ser/Thr protein kinase RdoA (MazF antagonist)
VTEPLPDIAYGPEIPLLGGTANVSRVVRVGDTVRRPQHAGSTGRHALLAHLEAVGFEGAPRFLGVDREGREVLSFVDGDVPIRPYPSWALTDAALATVAELLGRYHAAVASFDPAPYDWPVGGPVGSGPQLVCHNDPNLDNVVFRSGRAVALIDFDLAGPAPRICDLAAAVRLWAPLRGDEDIHDLRRGRGLQRLSGFAAACGLTAAERADLAEAIVPTHDWIYTVIERAARDGHPGLRHYWTPETASRVGRARQWCLDTAEEIRAALA